jgi:hypothetical protein
MNIKFKCKDNTYSWLNTILFEKLIAAKVSRDSVLPTEPQILLSY